MNNQGYRISNRKNMRGKVLLWDWKDLLIIMIFWGINYLLITPFFKDTTLKLQSYYILPLVFATAIAEHPEYNIKIYQIFWKYIKFFLMPKHYYFKQKGERRRWMQ